MRYIISVVLFLHREAGPRGKYALSNNLGQHTMQSSAFTGLSDAKARTFMISPIHKRHETNERIEV